jgi:hypothetical protein
VDAQGVLQAAHDSTNDQLRVTVVPASSSTARSGREANGIWNAVFDSASGAIRVVMA